MNGPTQRARGGPRPTVGFKLALIGTGEPLRSKQDCFIRGEETVHYHILSKLVSSVQTAPSQSGYARGRQRIYLDKQWIFTQKMFLKYTLDNQF